MGLVIGNCIYSMGAIRNWLVGIKGNFQGELREYSQLMYQARELALSHMQYEADQLGADGVIGVDINIEFMHNNEWMEVTAIGTAIRWVGSGPNMPPTGQGPPACRPVELGGQLKMYHGLKPTQNTASARTGTRSDPFARVPPGGSMRNSQS